MSHSKLKYYSAVDPITGKPHKDHLFHGDSNFDAYHGSYNNIKQQLLGKMGVRGKSFDDQDQLVRYYDQYYSSPISVYDEMFGTVRIIGDQTDTHIKPTSDHAYLSVSHLFRDEATPAAIKPSLVELLPHANLVTKWGLFGSIEKSRFASLAQGSVSGSEKGGAPKPIGINDSDLNSSDHNHTDLDGNNDNGSRTNSI